MSDEQKTNVLIALGLFDRWLAGGEQIELPEGFEEYNSFEFQAFYAGMMARKRFIVDGGNKDVR